jgi:site-specific DNA recombinase
MDSMSKPLDGYIRVSRVGGRSGESYISPRLQRAAIESWAHEHGLPVVFQKPEEDVSGGTMNRPIFNEVMRRIRAGESGGIVVYKFDRFARTLIGGLAVLQELAAVGAVFASATEPYFDFTSPTGKLHMRVNLLLAEYFREQSRDTWARAMAFTVERGVHMTRAIPYGYSKGPDKRLYPNEAAPFMAKAFALRAKGWNYPRIAAWLNEHAPPRADGRAWAPITVKAQLRRRVYLGVAQWGRHLNSDAHDPIVDPEVWEQAQWRPPGGYSAPLPSPATEQALLLGIVRCAGCRFRLTRTYVRDGNRRRRYYRCIRVRVSGRCTAPANIRADFANGLDAYVEGVVCDELDRLVSAPDPDEAELAAAERAKAKAKDELDRACESITRDRHGSRQLDAVEAAALALDEAEARVSEIKAMAEGAMAGRTSEQFRGMTRPERAAFLAAAIDCVMVRKVDRPLWAAPISGQRVRIFWRGTGPDLPPSHVASKVMPWVWPEDTPRGALENAQ